MDQSKYLEIAIELYDIYSANDIHHKKWLSARDLAKLKGGPGLIAKVKRSNGKLSELKPVFADYVNTKTQYQSCNTPQQWTCKFDKWLFNEYEFTNEEIDELHTNRVRQIGRETSEKVTN